MKRKNEIVITKEEKTSYTLKISAVYATGAILLLLGRVFIYYFGSYIAAFSWAALIGVCALFTVFEKQKGKEPLSFAIGDSYNVIIMTMLFISVLLVMIPLSLYGDMITSLIGVKEYSAMSYAERDGVFSMIVNCVLSPIIGTTTLFFVYIYPRLSRIASEKNAVLIFALLFGFLYLDDFANLIPRILLGALCAFVISKTRSIFLPICYFSVYQIGVAFTSYLANEGNTGGETMGALAVTSLFLIFSGVATPLFAYACHCIRNGKAKPKASGIAAIIVLAIVLIAIGITILL